MVNEAASSHVFASWALLLTLAMFIIVPVSIALLIIVVWRVKRAVDVSPMSAALFAKAPVDSRLCRRAECGCSNPQTASFCRRCGEALQPISSTHAASPAAGPVPVR